MTGNYFFAQPSGHGGWCLAVLLKYLVEEVLTTVFVFTPPEA